MSSVTDRLPPHLAAELARQYDVLRLIGQGGERVIALPVSERVPTPV